MLFPNSVKSRIDRRHGCLQREETAHALKPLSFTRQFFAVQYLCVYYSDSPRVRLLL
jgi:hypothetical protein